MMCEVCNRRERSEFWTVCGQCSEEHLRCLRTEGSIRRKMRGEISRGSDTTTTTPGMKSLGAAINERRGRKILRHFRQEVFLWDEDGNELE